MCHIGIYSLLVHYDDGLAPGAAGWKSWRVLATDRNVVCPEWEIPQISIKQEVNEGGVPCLFSFHYAHPARARVLVHIS